MIATIKKRQSNWPTAPYTTTVAEGIIVSIMEHCHLYLCKRVETNSFQVTFQGNGESTSDVCTEIIDSTDIMSAPIPLFSRVHTVCVDKFGVMFCNCCAFESTGFFCVHMVRVAEYVASANGETFKGFTHRDIAVRWTSSYMQLAFKYTTPKTIQSFYDTLSSNNIKGPKLQHQICNNILLECCSDSLPAEMRLKNYSIDDIDIDGSEPFDGFETRFVEPSGCSQNLEKLFSNAIEDSVLITESKMDARSVLKASVDDAYRMADDIGVEGVKKLEEILNEFKTWCNRKRAEKETPDSTLKRKFIPMTSDNYISNVKRVFNTHHM